MIIQKVRYNPFSLDIVITLVNKEYNKLFLNLKVDEFTPTARGLQHLIYKEGKGSKDFINNLSVSLRSELERHIRSLLLDSLEIIEIITVKDKDLIVFFKTDEFKAQIRIGANSSSCFSSLPKIFKTLGHLQGKKFINEYFKKL